MDSKDYILLEYLSKHNKSIQIGEAYAPHELKVNFQFVGLTRNKFPNSIWVRLFELEKYKLVKDYGSDTWGITEEGRIELKKYLRKQRNIMVSEETLLRYFFKKGRNLTVDDLFEKFDVDDSILKPIQYLVHNDWIEEVDNDPLNWQITDEGKIEFERRQKINSPQPINTFLVSGNSNVINTGLIEGDLKANIKNLNESGQKQISEDLALLVETIKGSNELHAEQKNQYLETLKLLSEEALKPKVERLPTSTLKQIIQFGIGSLNTFSSIATIAGINLTNISEYFLT